MILIATSFPVGTCLASFTFAKLPLPIVFNSLYLPICSSAGRHRDEEIPLRICMFGEPWDLKRNIHINLCLKVKQVVNLEICGCFGHLSFVTLFTSYLYYMVKMFSLYGSATLLERYLLLR